MNGVEENSARNDGPCVDSRDGSIRIASKLVSSIKGEDSPLRMNGSLLQAYVTTSLGRS